MKSNAENDLPSSSALPHYRVRNVGWTQCVHPSLACRCCSLPARPPPLPNPLPPSPPPRRRQGRDAALPPIPLVTGALQAERRLSRCRTPSVEARDSNFIFGSIGNGQARLWINGAPVTVSPNGAFLAWLPVPPTETPRYELLAVDGADTVRVEHPVRVQAATASSRHRWTARVRHGIGDPRKPARAPRR